MAAIDPKQAYQKGARDERNVWITKIEREVKGLKLSSQPDIFIAAALIDLKMWGIGRRILFDHLASRRCPAKKLCGKTRRGRKAATSR